MPLATPPADIDPTVVPPAHKHPTERETPETGVTSRPQTGTKPLTSDDKRVADLVKLWPQDRAPASFFLAWQIDC